VIGAVILRYNGDAASLEQAVRSLVGHGTSANQLIGDVLLVDNASTSDPTAVDRVAALFDDRADDGKPLVRTLHRPRNDGFAAGNNDGINRLRSTCDLVLIHNDDARLTDGSLTVLNDTLRTAAADVVSVGPKTLLDASGHLIDSVGMAVNGRGEAKNIGLGQPDLGQFDNGSDPFEVFGPCFAVALIRRSAFAESSVGPLPAHYFLYYEDVAWNWRAQRLGFRSLCAPEAVAIHQMSSSSRSTSSELEDAERAYSFKHRCIERNLLATGIELLPASDALTLWFHRWPRLVKGGITGRFPRASFMAAVDALVGLPKTLRRRRNLARRSGVDPRAPLRFWSNDPIFFDPVTYQPERSWRALGAAVRGLGVAGLADACERQDAPAMVREARAVLDPEPARALERYLSALGVPVPTAGPTG
jgi:GT2 family glycosyltransferase